VNAAGGGLADVAPATYEDAGRRPIAGFAGFAGLAGLAGTGERETGPGRGGNVCLGPEVKKAYQTLHLLLVERRHEGLLCCQGVLCTTLTAGRRPVGNWSPHLKKRRGGCEWQRQRQLVTQVSCTCDGGRLFWGATLAGIRGVGHDCGLRR
jgi:hypothetical protein